MPKAQQSTGQTQALPFIQVDPQTKQLRVTEEAKKSLSGVKGTLGICTVAGVCVARWQ